MIIAIDGPAAAGKGTLARRLAQHLNFAYLDTGLIYRAVAKKVLIAGADLEDAAAAEALHSSCLRLLPAAIAAAPAQPFRRRHAGQE